MDGTVTGVTGSMGDKLNLVARRCWVVSSDPKAVCSTSNVVMVQGQTAMSALPVQRLKCELQSFCEDHLFKKIFYPSLGATVEAIK